MVSRYLNQSVGTIFFSKKTQRYLFVLRSKSSHENTWAFVGGKVEHGETAYAALQREIEEELGFNVDWLEMPEKKGCSIYLSSQGNLLDKNKWEQSFIWFKENVETFHKVFSPRVKQL